MRFGKLGSVVPLPPPASEPTHDSNTTEPVRAAALLSGIDGLDKILRGGFPCDEMHLVQGAPGTGKTTLALQFLLAGARAGENALYITVSQTASALEAIARSHRLSA